MHKACYCRRELFI